LMHTDSRTGAVLLPLARMKWTCPNLLEKFLRKVYSGIEAMGVMYDKKDSPNESIKRDVEL